MADWFIKNYTVITVVAVILCGIALYFAIRATSRHNKLYREEEEKILRLKALKEKFTVLSPEVISSADSTELLEGVALHYQLIIQKERDIEKAFSALPICAKYVYTLDIFSSEGGVLSEFYKNNGNILRELFIPALKETGEEKLAEIAYPVSRMYDPDDEEASIDTALTEKADSEFSKLYDKERFLLSAAEYIKREAENFI